MADVSGSYVRGLLLAREIVPWAAQSSYTEQSPIPGYPVASAATDLRLVASGTPTGTAAYDVRLQHGGTPGQVDHGPQAAIRRAGELNYLGHEQSGAISAWEAPDWSEANDISDPAIKALPNGTLVQVATEADGDIRCWTKAAAATAWTDRGVISGTAAISTFYPCLVVINDDIYCLSWRATNSYASGAPSADRPYYISVWRSVDSGVTWVQVQDFATVETDVRRSTLSGTGGEGVYSCGRIRAAYYDGQVCVLATLREQQAVDDQDHCRHWAGASLTARLDLVETFQVSHGGSGYKGVAKADVVATNSGFFVAMLNRGRNAITVHIGSAWQPIASAGLAVMSVPFDIQPGGGWSLVAGTAYALADTGLGECSLAFDPSGVVWLYTVATATAVLAGTHYGYYSTDLGATWTTAHASYPATNDISGYWYRPVDTGVAPPNPLTGTQGHGPAHLDAVWYRGLVVIAHSWYAAVYARSRDQVGVAYLGGWSDLTLPYDGHGIKIGHRVGWLHNVLPLELPEDQNYTVATGGTFTSALVTPGRHRMTTGDGAGNIGQNYYEFVGVNNATTQHGGAEFSVLVNSTQGTGTTAVIGLRMRLASPTHGVECEIDLTASGIYVRDFVAGTALGSATALAAGEYTVRLGMAMHAETGTGRALQVWYRAKTYGEPEKRRWTRIGQWTLTDDAGAGGTAPRVQWGHIIGSGNLTQNSSEWVGPHFFVPYNASLSVVGTYAGWHDLDQAGGDNPGKLPGRPLGTRLVYGMDGLTLAGRRGPGWIGDTWSITPTGEYSVQRGISLVSPSPRLGWRSVGATTQQIAWAADPDNPGVEDCAHPPMLGIAIYGGNHRRARLDSRSAAGVWTTRLDVSTALLDGVAFTRTGNVLSPAATGTTYLHRDECAGWYVELANGATLRRRKVIGNDEGRWSNAGTEPVARLYLDDIATTDPGGGGAQTLTLWPDAWVGMVRGLSCAAWRLYLDSAYATFEGDVRAKVFFGPVHLFGLQPSWGRGIELEAGHELPEIEGRVPVRIDRSPPRRQVTIGWDEGVDTREVYGTTASRYVTPSSAGGTEPTAALAATPGSLLHALRRHGGRPVVYLPALARTAATTWLMARRDQHMLATIASGPTLQPFLGSELEDEVQRVAALELLEVR